MSLSTWHESFLNFSISRARMRTRRGAFAAICGRPAALILAHAHDGHVRPQRCRGGHPARRPRGLTLATNSCATWTNSLTHSLTQSKLTSNSLATHSQLTRNSLATHKVIWLMVSGKMSYYQYKSLIIQSFLSLQLTVKLIASVQPTSY